MKLTKYAGMTSAVCAMSLVLSGSAMASDVSLDTTGPDSNQEVTITNSSSYTVNNENTVSVSNVNAQNASTGNVSATRNTSVDGSLGSGDATNTNGTGTTVSIENLGSAVGGAGQGTNGGINQPAGGQGTTGGTNQSAGGRGGSALGAATSGGLGGAGVATLPQVGPSSPIDVSALRAAWNPQTSGTAAAVAKGSALFTAPMLAAAALLSLLGALGSIVYARRREEKI